MARRSVQTPLQQIIKFFLTAPIAEIRQGIEVGQEIVNHRLAVGEGTQAPRRLPRPPAAAVTAPVTAPKGETIAQVASGLARTRRKRSDAGVSRKRGATVQAPAQAVSAGPQPVPDTAANGPGPRRRRPAVMAAAPVPVGAENLRVPDLPDQTVDPSGD